MALRTTVSRSRGTPGFSLRGSHRLVVHHLPDELVPIGLVEGRPQRQQFVERQAEAVHVAAEVPLAVETLRGHVAQRADDVAGVGQVVAVSVCLGQAEVGHPNIARVIEQQVRRLDVAMQHPLAGGMGQGVGHLHADTGDALPVLTA